MAAQVWQHYVPATSGTDTIPLNYHQLLQEMIPVYKCLVTTAAIAPTVTLPTAFQTKIAGDAALYAVSLHKQTYDAGGGDLKITSKTATNFKVSNTGSVYGESVLVMVWWLPA